MSEAFAVASSAWWAQAGPASTIASASFYAIAKDLAWGGRVYGICAEVVVCAG